MKLWNENQACGLKRQCQSVRLPRSASTLDRFFSREDLKGSQVAEPQYTRNISDPEETGWQIEPVFCRTTWSGLLSSGAQTPHRSQHWSGGLIMVEKRIVWT